MAETHAGTVDVRGHYRAPESEPLVPGRLRKPLVHVEDQAAPDDLVREVAEWLNAHMGLFLANSMDGRFFGWDLPGWEDHAPALASAARNLILDKMTPEALEAIAVPEFEPTGIEVFPTLHHHGGFVAWHDDWLGIDGKPVTDRRVAFDLFLHTADKMFRGGDLEFLGGDPIEPRNKRLVFRHPIQTHRVAPVECWSAEALHGRWSLSGWVLGAPPDGWVDRVETLRCRA